MIEFIGKLIFLPFTIMGYMITFIGYFLYAMIVCMVWCVQIIINFIKFFLSLFSKKNYSPRYVKLSSLNSLKNNSSKKDVGKKYNEISNFDREADLWGLSKEDKKLAKEERMSPADYIEAEERDDDLLDTDEWE